MTGNKEDTEKVVSVVELDLVLGVLELAKQRVIEARENVILKETGVESVNSKQ